MTVYILVVRDVMNSSSGGRERNDYALRSARQDRRTITRDRYLVLGIFFISRGVGEITDCALLLVVHEVKCYS